MPTYQGRLLSCLILSAISAHTWADTVLVNTTADTSAKDELCSLREAVSYLSNKNIKKADIDAKIAVINTALVQIRNNLALKQLKLAQEQNKEESLQDKTLIANLIVEIGDDKTGLKKEIADKEADIAKLNKELEDYQAAGIDGCKSSLTQTPDTIQLQKSTSPYEINNTAIVINGTLTIAPDTLPTSNTDPLAGLENSGVNTDPRMIIKAIGNHALFMIDDGKVSPTRYISVTFNDLDFQGCDANFCSTNGGIFFNKEELIINNSVVSGGIASAFGGAVYNDINAIFAAKQVSFEKNKANDGAAIYSEQTAIFIESSLFTQNTPADGFSIVKVATKTSILRGTLLPSIVNSTFSGNSGTAISSQKTLSLKNLTIVLNSVGINFNGDSPLLYSSIIAGNTTDCVNMGAIPDDKNTYIANNIYQMGCEIALTGNINEYNPNHNKLPSGEKIIADTDVNGKNTGEKCAAPPADGLLCPLSANGGITKTHKPRLLSKYNKLSDSYIVNKGYSITSLGELTCPSTDQRALPREKCDMGAVELQKTISAKQGQDITFGQKAFFSLFGQIGDGELLPASQCAAIFGSIVGGYHDGCVNVIDAPTKGIASIDNLNHQLIYYTSSPDFHGYDDFSYGMTTTLSRFSDAINNQQVKIKVRVVSDPPGSLSSKSLDSGATSILSLLMLSLLMVWRRIR